MIRKKSVQSKNFKKLGRKTFSGALPGRSAGLCPSKVISAIASFFNENTFKLVSKNIPIAISVFISSAFLTIFIYFMGTNLINSHREMMENNPYAGSIDYTFTLEEVEKLKAVDLPNISEIAYTEEERKSARLGDKIVAVESFDEVFSKNFGKSILESGRMPEVYGEISLDEALVESLGLELGDEVQVEYGGRLVNDEVIEATSTWTDKETFKLREKRTYKLVGITKAYLNKNLGLGSCHRISQSKERNLRVFLNFDDIYRAEETKAEVDEFLKDNGLSGELLINANLKNYYGLDKSIVQRYMAKSVNIISILIVILSFVLIIKNIFSIWGIGKLRELSMYKSIGSTDFQILKLLSKEAVTMSIIPVPLGHLVGFFTLKYSYAYIEREFLDVVSQRTLMEFVPVISLLVLGLSFLVVILATLKPAREIAKISIIDGLRGNLSFKDRKKRGANNIWKELRVNNRKIFKAQRYISTVGISLIGLLLLVLTLSRINDDFFNVESPYNLRINYFISDYKLPEKLLEIRDKTDAEEKLIFATKYIYIPYEENMFTDDFKRIGFDKDFENFYYPEKEMLEGQVYFYDEDSFKKMGGSGRDYLLLNRVQENVKEKPDVNSSIRFLKNYKDLKVKFFEEGRTYDIGDIRELEDLESFKDFFRYYNLYLYTSFENYEGLMEKFNEEGVSLGYKPSRQRFTLCLKVDPSMLDGLEKDMEKELKESISYDESFNIVNGKDFERKREMELKSFALIVGLVGLVIFGINLINSYTSTKLSFINRRQELGVLLSAGMEREELTKSLSSAFLKDQINSLAISLVIVLLSMLIVTNLVFFAGFQSLIEYYNWQVFILAIVIVFLSNYTIYRRVMKKTLEDNIVDLLK